MSGQDSKPDYGAHLSEYGSNYNPYLYGGNPQENVVTEEESQAHNQERLQPVDPQRPFLHQQQESQQQNIPALQSGGQQSPFVMMREIDPEDPQRNPYYGKWNPLSIIAFVFLFTPFPIVSIILGLISARAIRKFHMKGLGLSIASILIGISVILSYAWLLYHGYSFNNMPSWFPGGQHTPDTGSTGDGMIYALL